jgi:hypothetical protein
MAMKKERDASWMGSGMRRTHVQTSSEEDEENKSLSVLEEDSELRDFLKKYGGVIFKIEDWEVYQSLVQTVCGR